MVRMLTKGELKFTHLALVNGEPCAMTALVQKMPRWCAVSSAILATQVPRTAVHTLGRDHLALMDIMESTWMTWAVLELKAIYSAAHTEVNQVSLGVIIADTAKMLA